MTRAAALILALVLLAFGVSSCGDDKSDASSAVKDTPAATEDSAPGTDDATQDPTTPPVFTDGPGDVTLAFSGGEETLGSGEFDQSEVTISVGQIVEFAAGDGGTYAVKVGGLDGVTIKGGLKEYYRFDAAGTYSVVEDLSGGTASVIVE